MVLPQCNLASLGAIPTKDLDVVINPRQQELELHQYHTQMSLKGMRE